MALLNAFEMVVREVLHCLTHYPHVSCDVKVVSTLVHTVGRPDATVDREMSAQVRTLNRVLSIESSQQDHYGLTVETLLFTSDYLRSRGVRMEIGRTVGRRGLW
jgi:hypothetical protein